MWHTFAFTCIKANYAFLIRYAYALTYMRTQHNAAKHSTMQHHTSAYPHASLSSHVGSKALQLAALAHKHIYGDAHAYTRQCRARMNVPKSAGQAVSSSSKAPTAPAKGARRDQNLWQKSAFLRADRHACVRMATAGSGSGTCICKHCIHVRKRMRAWQDYGMPPKPSLVRRVHLHRAFEFSMCRGPLRQKLPPESVIGPVRTCLQYPLVCVCHMHTRCALNPWWFSRLKVFRHVFIYASVDGLKPNFLTRNILVVFFSVDDVCCGSFVIHIDTCIRLSQRMCA
jgi:hypothetical protein